MALTTLVSGVITWLDGARTIAGQVVDDDGAL
jgi:hypothetical protein